MTEIPNDQRLIVALDVPTVSVARDLVCQLSDTVKFYKVGLELFMDPGCFDFIDWLNIINKKVFVDLKFFDVPNTVASAVHQLQHRPIEFITVHGNDSILEAACIESVNTKILAVTALTSLDENDIMNLGFQVDITSLVLSRAKRALEIGCAGVISSGLEVAALRKEVRPWDPDKFIIVVPGIRPGANVDDQKRTVTIKDAFDNGADYIVVGRPILIDSQPVKIAETIQQQIAEIFWR